MKTMGDFNERFQSNNWDMNITFEELIRNNKECKVDRNYKSHKYDDCFNGYCMYVKYSKNSDFETMIGIREDGFTYIGNGNIIKNLPLENTLGIIKEMSLFAEWVKEKELNKHILLNTKGIYYDNI